MQRLVSIARFECAFAGQVRNAPMQTAPHDHALIGECSRRRRDWPCEADCGRRPVDNMRWGTHTPGMFLLVYSKRGTSRERVRMSVNRRELKMINFSELYRPLHSSENRHVEGMVLYTRTLLGRDNFAPASAWGGAGCRHDEWRECAFAIHASS